MNRLMRPLIWAITAVAVGAAIGLFTSAKAEPPSLLPHSARADKVLIEKADRRLTLIRDGRAIAAYDIALGFAAEGDKVREGDGKTPEGHYKINRRNDKSSFTLSLGIDYPRPDQRAEARRDGRNPGGDIFIHGQPTGYAGPKIRGDWTAGCAALSNEEMREIWSRVAIGTAVEIRP